MQDFLRDLLGAVDMRSLDGERLRHDKHPARVALRS